MKIRKRDSGLIVDRRGQGGGGRLPVSLPVAAGGLGLPILLVIVVVSLLMGGGPFGSGSGGFGVDSPYGGFPAAPANEGSEPFVPENDTAARNSAPSGSAPASNQATLPPAIPSDRAYPPLFPVARSAWVTPPHKPHCARGRGALAPPVSRGRVCARATYRAR